MSEHPFLRNEMIWGPEAQEKLSRSHVILFGLGGVGSYAAECLARSGIGELTIVDNDTVSVTNRNRQLEALASTVGQRKTDAVAARLLDINPSLKVHPIFGTYNAENRGLHGRHQTCRPPADITVRRTAGLSVPERHSYLSN